MASDQCELKAINAEIAWDITKGDSSIFIAIIDSDFEITHEDLINQLWINVAEIPNNGIDDDANGFIDDVSGWDFFENDNNVTSNYFGASGHGTNVAGVCCAQTNNNKGIASLGFKTKFLPIKCSNDTNSTYHNVDQAIMYAGLMNARILNCSFGSIHRSFVTESIINWIYDSIGTIVVASSGNDFDYYSIHPNYPANFNKVISVSGFNEEDLKKDIYTVTGPWVDICAPSNDLKILSKNNTYLENAGTSGSAPMVAATAALMLAIDSTLINEDIKTCILASSVNTNSLNNILYDDLYGWGNLDSYAALKYMQDRVIGGLTEAKIGLKYIDTVICLGEEINMIAFTPNANYLWRFPGSSLPTTTDRNPVGVFYTNPGVYSITLIVERNGIYDSITLPNAIHVVDRNCELSLIPDDTIKNIESSSGTLYDAGSFLNRAEKYKESIITINPPNANQLYFKPALFNYGTYSDSIYFYDGLTTSSPLIGKYQSNDIIPIQQTTANALTVKVIPDSYDTDEGLELHWDTIINSPVAQFYTKEFTANGQKIEYFSSFNYGDTIEICSGTSLQFYNNSKWANSIKWDYDFTTNYNANWFKTFNSTTITSIRLIAYGSTSNDTLIMYVKPIIATANFTYNYIDLYTIKVKNTSTPITDTSRIKWWFPGAISPSNSGYNNLPFDSNGYVTAYYDTAGVYTVCLAIDSCSKDTICDSIIIGDFSTIKDLANSNFFFSVYPNPTSNDVNILSSTKGDVLVFNNIGELIAIKEVLIGKNHFTISGLTPGVYYLKLNENSKKLMVID